MTLFQPIAQQSHISIVHGRPILAFPAGIIDSAEAQMKLNLNEWVCTDMNVC